MRPFRAILIEQCLQFQRQGKVHFGHYSPSAPSRPVRAYMTEKRLRKSSGSDDSRLKVAWEASKAPSCSVWRE